MRLALILWILLSGASAPPEETVVTIERSSQCGTWQVAIYASGFAHAHYAGGCGDTSSDVSTLRRISKTQLRILLQTVKKAEFLTLPARIHPEMVATDEDVLTIRVRTGSKETIVGAFGLDRVTDKAVARRFLTVWEAVGAIVPEPKD